MRQQDFFKTNYLIFFLFPTILQSKSSFLNKGSSLVCAHFFPFHQETIRRCADSHRFLNISVVKFGSSQRFVESRALYLSQHFITVDIFCANQSESKALSLPLKSCQYVSQGYQSIHVNKRKMKAAE